MTLIEQASLVLIPSGYKEDTVYSVVPSDGSGDLSFTRASNGTRVNSAGLVEDCPWNLYTYSEQPSNAAWTGGGNGKPTMTDNFAEAPNGTMTASKMEVAGTGYQIRQNNAIENTQMNVSVWLRTNTGTKTIELFLNNANTASQNITVTTTWTRYEISGLVTTLSGSGRNGLHTLEALTSGAYILVWGFQLSVGLSAKPYFPTTDRLNVPRLTYQNGGGGCPSLLLEKQSTNLVTYSEDFSNAAWALDGDGAGQSVTANYSTSPDGTQNADRIQLSRIGGTYSRIRQVLVAPSTGSISASIYLKTNDNTTKTLNFRLGSAGSEIITVTPNYQRFVITKSVTGGIAYDFELFIDASTGTTIDMSGWGAQYEASSYPTSYIPTTSSSATRVADASNTAVSSLILPQASGTIFVQFDWQKAQVDSNIVSVHNNSNNLAWITKNSTTQLFGTFFMSGYIGTIQPTISASSGVIKVAYAWTNGSQTMFVNGVEVGTATGTITSSPYFNYVQLNGFWGINKDGCEIQEAVLFTTKLTNAELAQLTA